MRQHYMRFRCLSTAGGSPMRRRAQNRTRIQGWAESSLPPLREGQPPRPISSSNDSTVADEENPFRCSIAALGGREALRSRSGTGLLAWLVRWSREKDRRFTAESRASGSTRSHARPQAPLPPAARGTARGHGRWTRDAIPELTGAAGRGIAECSSSELPPYRNRLVRARSTISSPRPFNMALIM
jgi:hypothetical protein